MLSAPLRIFCEKFHVLYCIFNQVLKMCRLAGSQPSFVLLIHFWLLTCPGPHHPPANHASPHHIWGSVTPVKKSLLSYYSASHWGIFRHCQLKVTPWLSSFLNLWVVCCSSSCFHFLAKPLLQTNYFNLFVSHCFEWIKNKLMGIKLEQGPRDHPSGFLHSSIGSDKVSGGLLKNLYCYTKSNI